MCIKEGPMDWLFTDEGRVIRGARRRIYVSGRHGEEWDSICIIENTGEKRLCIRAPLFSAWYPAKIFPAAISELLVELLAFAQVLRMSRYLNVVGVLSRCALTLKWFHIYYLFVLGESLKVSFRGVGSPCATSAFIISPRVNQTKWASSSVSYS